MYYRTNNPAVCAKHTRFFALAVAAMLITVLTLPHAAGADVLDEVMVRQAKIRTVEARFTQEKKTVLMKRPIRSEGRFFFRQPDRIRWEYGGSASLHVIFNGRDLWLYYPELKEADRLAGAAQYASLMQFDIASLARNYEATARKENRTYVVRFVPRSKGPISAIEMTMPEETAFPATVKLFDSRNDETLITFTHVKLNAGLREELFAFTPLHGVRVREQNVP